MCHGHYGEILADETACVPECTSSTGGLIPGTIAVCGRFASKHRVFSVMLGLCAVGFVFSIGNLVSPQRVRWSGSQYNETIAHVLLGFIRYSVFIQKQFSMVGQI